MSPKGTVSYGAVTEREIKDGEEVRQAVYARIDFPTIAVMRD